MCCLNDFQNRNGEDAHLQIKQQNSQQCFEFRLQVSGVAPWGLDLGYDSHPGDSIRANGTTQKWTPLGMLPASGSIPRKLTQHLPSTRLQSGTVRLLISAAWWASSAASRAIALSNAVYTVVLQKSTPTQIRQLILYYD